jgi:hypothetical protein
VFDKDAQPFFSRSDRQTDRQAEQQQQQQQQNVGNKKKERSKRKEIGWMGVVGTNFVSLRVKDCHEFSSNQLPPITTL